MDTESRGRMFGATYKVTLDTAREEIGKTDLDSRAPTGPPKRLRILLVEDHRETRHTLSRMLSHFGHEVLTADNKQSAVGILGLGKANVLLCDIGLPDGSGYEVISQ